MRTTGSRPRRSSLGGFGLVRRASAAAAIGAACLLPAASGATTSAPGPVAATRGGTPFDRFAAAGARSSDLRLRILFSTRTVPFGDDGSYTEQVVIPLRRLVDDARGSTDPLVLSLLLQRCRHGNEDAVATCDRIDVARRWVAADTQNQMAWLALAAESKAAGDVVGARAAFVRGAGASRWHEPDVDLGRVLIDTIPRDATPDDRSTALAATLGAVAATTMPFQEIAGFCREGDHDADLLDGCRRIVTTMARDTDSLIGLQVAVRLAARAGVDRVVVEGFQRTADAIQWGMQPRADEPVDLDEATGAQRDSALASWTARVTDGERAWSVRRLAEQRLTEAEAARRYVATLGNGQLALRAQRLAGR